MADDDDGRTDGGGEDEALGRLGGFMDAVFAIAITLPIVQLTPPSTSADKDLATGYRTMAPEFIAYVLGFIVIGLFWNNSHFGSKLLKKTDHGFNLLTLVFLAGVSLTPFPARPYVEHFDDAVNVEAAALVYGLVLSSPILIWFLRWLWGYSRGLYDDDLSRRYVTQMTWRWGAAVVVALAGDLLLALGHPGLGLGLVALATVSFILPPSEPFDDVLEIFKQDR